MEYLVRPDTSAPPDLPPTAGTCINGRQLLLFLECPRCFYLSSTQSIERLPPLRSELHLQLERSLQTEFDDCRTLAKQHPLLQQQQIPALPLVHENINHWRGPAQGIDFFHPMSGIRLSANTDDVWSNKAGRWHLVVYATAYSRDEVDRNEKWHLSCKRRLDLLSWLFNQCGYPLHDNHYFLLFQSIVSPTNKNPLHGIELALQPYTSNSIWVEEALFSIRKCLNSPETPAMNEDCAFCRYQQALSRRESAQETLTFTHEAV